MIRALAFSRYGYLVAGTSAALRVLFRRVPGTFAVAVVNFLRV